MDHIYNKKKSVEDNNVNNSHYDNVHGNSMDHSHIESRYLGDNNMDHSHNEYTHDEVIV